MSLSVGGQSPLGTCLGVRSAGPGSVALSPSLLSLSSLGIQCRPGIVLRFKNKGILAWALLAQGKRGWSCPAPKGIWLEKETSPSSTTSMAESVGVPREPLAPQLLLP